MLPILRLEDSEESYGTISDYATGKVKGKLNRKGYGRRAGFVGHYYMTINGDPVKLYVSKSSDMDGSAWYIAPYTPRGERRPTATGGGKTAAAAIKDLAKKMLDKGMSS